MKTIVKAMMISAIMTASAGTTMSAQPNDSAGASSDKSVGEFKYNDERFADLQMLRYRVEGFEQLTL